MLAPRIPNIEAVEGGKSYFTFSNFFHLGVKIFGLRSLFFPALLSLKILVIDGKFTQNLSWPLLALETYCTKDLH